MDPEQIKKMVEEDYQKKLELARTEESYYPGKLQEFGLKNIDRFVKYNPNPSNYMKFGITFGHKDLEVVAEAMANNEPWAVVSGLNPSSPLHLGHKAVFDELLWFQEQGGADIFIPITNDETYVVGKSESLANARKMAYENIIPSIIAMGFNPEKTHIYVDSDYTEIYNVAMDISRKLTLNKLFGVFGWDHKEPTENPGKVFYMGAVQLAQILLPQYPEFGGPKPTIIPVGIDQHPYILLARDIAEKKGFIPPAEVNWKFLAGLDGKGKMSSSRDGSAIFLTDTPEIAEKKLKKAYTGGSISGDYQKEHGGIPEICPVYGIRMYHFEKDKNLESACKTGKLLCGACKQEAITQVKDWLADHQRKLPDAKKRIDDFLLKTPIRSIFE
ncbi:tryptophan--tRNA ligase [archaeon]|nr:tryptophan--tRNA ligase [archaeon]